MFTRNAAAAWRCLIAPLSRPRRFLAVGFPSKSGGRARRPFGSSLEQDVVGGQPRRLLRARSRVRPRLDDELVTRLEDDRLLVGDVDALTRERVLVGAPLADASFE